MTPALQCRLLSAALAAACAACAAPAERRFPPPLATASDRPVPADRAAALLARARAYDRATGDLSALVRVEVRDVGRGEGLAARGGVAVRRPGAMRMQMTGPGGVTAVDLLAREERYWLRIAGRDWETGRLDGPPRRGFPAASVARIFLGLDWERARVVRDAALAVAALPAPEGRVLVAFDARDGATREVRWFAGDVEQARARFAEFEREANGARFPRVVLFWQREPAVTVTVVVERRTLAPELPPATFAPPAPPG